ncbi:unnamed protein product [Toxocara canis]|uniref:Uncharacterized protein n=1 Tax=Toxocara canis TaxID=6265 RepID=A0A183U8K7_TOXCA|nr:unnamed protein product [Toxocara canis]
MFSRTQHLFSALINFILLDVPLSSLFSKQPASEIKNENGTLMNKDELLDRVIDLEEVAIDSAPFQLVLGSSLYKVFSIKINCIFS